MSDGDDDPTDAADEAAAPDTDEATDESDAADDVDAEQPEDAPADGDAGDAEDEGGDESSDGADEDLPAPDLGPEELDERLDDVEAAVEDAETEADLDAAESDLDDVEAAIEAADLPVPDEDDEDAADPREELETRVSDIREAINEARGPYAEDVVADVEASGETVEETRWTERGKREAAEAVATFLGDVEEPLGESFSVEGEFPEGHAAALEDVAAAVEAADLDPDADAETIGDLLSATEALRSDLEAAEEWDDLTVVQKLDAEGFYDRLESGNRRDFPPELNVIRIAEQENDPERIITALETFDSDFMEENCIDALRRMGPPEAFDALLPLAERRDMAAIRAIGKIGDDAACETLHEFIEGDANPPLQRVVLEALGEIGSESSTQPVADRLVAEDPEVRSRAASALGRIGDTRAVEPLGDLLADDDSDSVRASAAWALYQIGTESALETAAEYADDRSYIVQTEAEKATEALDAAAPSP